MSIFIAGLLFSVLLVLRYSRTARLPVPPGPRKLPFIGNLMDMPSSYEWKTYMKWSRLFNSDVIHLNVVATSIIVLSSMEAATDLLEKRSNIYSDRSRLPMINELMGWTFHFGFAKYGDRWRKLRRMFHRHFNVTAVQKFYPKERAACHELLRRLLRDPDNAVHHLRHMAGAIILSAAYGITVLPENDPYIQSAEAAVNAMSYASIPGRFLVDTVPALIYLPEWFPGAGFKLIAKEWRQLTQKMIDEPFIETKRNMAAGNAPLSCASALLNDIQDSQNQDEQEMLVKEVAGTMYAGGTDTTVSVVCTFVLAMLRNPQAQRKAQVEIDSVVGDHRLPDFNDQDSLPYVSALIQEVYRWMPAGPLGVPHFLAVEDEYRGYRIPAQSIVCANMWAIFHDEAVYPDPYEFKPERWLLNGKLNSDMRGHEAAFGFGRRGCAGKAFAVSSVWITVTSILATFNITKSIDESGAVVEPTYEYTSTLISQPLPFKCSIKPRSEGAEKLVQETAE